jgi:hypothetical protein
MTAFTAAIFNFANAPENCTVFKIYAEFCTKHLVHGVSYWLEYVFAIHKKLKTVIKNPTQNSNKTSEL